MRRLRNGTTWLALSSLTLLAFNGCGDAPPPPRVAIPAASNRDAAKEADIIKPLAPVDERIDLRVDQRVATTQREAPPPPQASDSTAQVQRDFIDAYHKVGQPRIVVFVNRTLAGEVIHPEARDGPYLHSDQYDANAASHALDYAALEKTLADGMSLGGREIMVVPPSTTHDKLTDLQVKDLDEGKPQALASLDERLDADVLIQVQAHPTRQTEDGLQMRLVAEAINIRGGQEIGHAVADIERASDAQQMDTAAQYLVRKLMIDMLRFWSAPQQGAPN